MPVILIAVLAFMIIFSMRSQSKEKKKREQLLEAVKKGDKVQTIGGVRGTVTDIRDDEITLKVDENANVKIRYARSAIQSVISTKDED
ncbi:MAG: preprotein translocase subunit YajC [Phycisphaera sp.]|nr:preprotein translocase subunit YajC [Phycisphaera sp.]